MFGTMMTSSSSISVELNHAYSNYGPLSMEVDHFTRYPLTKSNNLYQKIMKLGQTV